MRKCISDYRRQSTTYLKGSEYDVSDDIVTEHETYFGRELWEATKSKSTQRREEAQEGNGSEETSSEETPKKGKGKK